jgi:transposase-like protein
MSRPGWNKEYWNRMDKETARKLRTACPKCGSDKTYYNKQFKIWRCGRCEHSWVIEKLGRERDPNPWWKRLLRWAGFQVR